MGISVKQELLDLALTHRSYSYEHGGIPTNERLEFLGDSVLGLLITEKLYERFPDLDESKLSPLRSGVVNQRALADIARTMQLGQHLRIGRGEESTGGRAKNSLLADSLEALVGAIYLEHGFDVTAQVVMNWFEEALSAASQVGVTLDAKTALQELTAQRGLGSPEYEITETGPDHDKSFTAVVVVGAVRYASGLGKSKREAEQLAARISYQGLISNSE